MSTIVDEAPPDVVLDRPKNLVGFSARLVGVARVGAVVSTAIGVVVVAGYLARWKWAIQLRPSFPPMYPTTALGFALGGGCALLATGPRRRWRLVAAAGFAVVALYGAATVGLHIAEAGPTFLEGLWPDHPLVAATSPVPGRPVVETCVSFICIGTAGALLAVRKAPRLAQGLALGTVSVGAAAVLGYVIGVDRRALGISFVVVGMALHTAVGLTALGLAVMLAQPNVGLFARLTHSGPSAQLGRRLIVAVVAAPIALTAASAALVRLLPDARLAQSVAAIGQILALGLLVILPIGAVERMDQAATDALLDARRLREEAGEQHVILAAIGGQLLEQPLAPDGWDIGFRQTAAFAALPGDTCQVLPADDGSRFLVALVDVAGHGTESALQALRLRTEVAALWRSGQPVAAIAAALDRSVSDLGTIATGVLLGIERSTGACQYVNAGHPPVVVDQGDGLERWPATRPLFGIDHGAADAVERSVARHGVVVAYTDGVTEARAADRRLLGEQAVEHALRANAAAKAQAVADACMDAALAHSNARLRDDALTLVLQRL